MLIMFSIGNMILVVFLLSKPFPSIVGDMLVELSKPPRTNWPSVCRGLEICGAVFLAPIVEELVFRGFFFTDLPSNGI